MSRYDLTDFELRVIEPLLPSHHPLRQAGRQFLGHDPARLNATMAARFWVYDLSSRFSA
jgi:transposase